MAKLYVHYIQLCWGKQVEKEVICEGWDREEGKGERRGREEMRRGGEGRMGVKGGGEGRMGVKGGGEGR